MKNNGTQYMKAHAEESAPMGGALWEGGAKTFLTREPMAAGRIY
jgi:aryl sulfotransferase